MLLILVQTNNSKLNIWLPIPFLLCSKLLNLGSHSIFSLIILFKCFSCSLLFNLFMRISDIFSRLYKNHLNYFISHTLIHTLIHYVHMLCIVWSSNITCHKYFSLTKIFMLCNNLVSNIISFTVSVSATYLPIQLYTWNEKQKTTHTTSCHQVTCIISVAETVNLPWAPFSCLWAQS